MDKGKERGCEGGGKGRENENILTYSMKQCRLNNFSWTDLSTLTLSFQSAICMLLILYLFFKTFYLSACLFPPRILDIYKSRHYVFIYIPND